jgi:hypothetical protein
MLLFFRWGIFFLLGGNFCVDTTINSTDYPDSNNSKHIRSVYAEILGSM